MTPQARFRRIGWFALLAVCTLFYGLLHLQVWSVSSEVKRVERRIVSLEQNKLLLETEFLTRSSQAQLAAWNRVDFGYTAPRADQFIGSERQLASFGADGEEGREEALRLASFSADEDVPPFPTLVSPITGEPLDEALVRPAQVDGESSTSVVAAVAAGAARVPLNAPARSGRAAAGTVRVMLAGAGQ